ncbi:hypothetical protein [Clostridium sp. HCS.1]|uniref:hypothetical protein n=1 Tax=Clostridium sp. HCS.1 TaxID=3238594 RepID=UPI003A0FCABF
MYKLLMIMILIATVKTFIAYLIAKLKSCKKQPISAEEIIQFKGLTRKQYEKLVAPIMWDNESYYEQLKFNIHDDTKYNKLSENKSNIRVKKPNIISIDDYHKQVEEEYESLKELFRNKHSNIS